MNDLYSSKKILRSIWIALLLSVAVSPIFSQQKAALKESEHTNPFSFDFFYTLGISKPHSTFSDPSYTDKFNNLYSLSHDLGFQLNIPISQRFSLRPGFSLQQKSFKEEVTNSGSLAVYGYSFNFPIWINYHAKLKHSNPFIGVGFIYNNYTKKDDGIFLIKNIETKVGLYDPKALDNDDLSLGIEIGNQFNLLNNQFSFSILYVHSWKESYKSTYGIIEDFIHLSKIVGHGSSNGSYAGLSLKYHLANTKRNKDIRVKKNQIIKKRKNYFSIDIMGSNYYGSISYERILLTTKWFKCSAKIGVFYRPEFEEKGVFINPKYKNSKQLSGLFIPTSFNMYLGKNNSFFHLGWANTLTYSPYYFPQHHNSDYGWQNYMLAIVGYRFERKRWLLGVQMVFQSSQAVPYPGLTLGRSF